jgi:hypothetical protein
MLTASSTPPFAPLPDEQTLYTSPHRIGLSISIPSHYPAKQQHPFSLSHANGQLFLTNRRVIYLPDKATDKLQSFAAPILNLHDSHVTAPFFGPNAWLALLQPVPDGGIPTPNGGVVELKFTFKDGGAFDFHSSYDRVRERLQQVMGSLGADSSHAAGSSAVLNNANLAAVNLDELPAYQEESSGPLLSPVSAVNQASIPVLHSAASGNTDSGPVRPSAPAPGAPVEPPPAYEEALGGDAQSRR